MSLLAGVRFVPKEERRGGGSDGSDTGDSASDSASEGVSGESRKHHKKKKKHSHKSDSGKHKKKSKDKDRDKDRDRKKDKDKDKDRKKKYNESKKKKNKEEGLSDFDLAAEIKFMENLVESEGLNKEVKVGGEGAKKQFIDGFEQYNMYDNNNNRSSMINYSRMALAEEPSSDEENEENGMGFGDSSRDVEEDSRRGYGRAESPSQGRSHISSSSTSQPAPTPAPAPAAVSNQSMAALLRARLQKGEKLVTAPAPASASATTSRANERERYGNSNDSHRRNSGRSSSSQNDNNNQGGDVDIASFMSVGELKWMSAYKLKQADPNHALSSSNNGIPSLPIPGEKNSSLQDLVAMEKSGGGITGNAGDIDKIFAANIIKRGSGYRGSELGLGSGMGAERGSGGDRAGMDEEEGMGVTSWLGAEADVDSDDNNSDNGDGKSSGKKRKKPASSVPSKNMIAKMKKKEKDLVNGVDMTMFQQKEDNMNDKQIYDRIVNKAMAKKKAYSQTVSNCYRCVVGRKFRKDLVLSTGSHFQLRLKSRNESLVPGWHCELVPLVHSSSVMLAEKEGEAESVVRDGSSENGLFKELERFKSCLQRMYERMGKGVVFMETATRSGINKHHTTVDVVPVPKGSEGEVHMSFKQAFRDSGDAFSTHKRRIISTNSISKPFHSCVPAHFPYLVVEWPDMIAVQTDEGKTDMQSSGGQTGLLYILDAAISINDSELDKEDTGDFNTSFCLDVMAGVLEIDQLERRMMRQRGGQVGVSTERSDVDRFREEWTVFDWTSYDCM